MLLTCHARSIVAWCFRTVEIFASGYSAILPYAMPYSEDTIPSQSVSSLIGGDPRPIGNGEFNESLR